MASLNTKRIYIINLYIFLYSANRITLQQKRSGKIWQCEYYDRSIRNEAHFDNAVKYIEYYPVKAGLANAQGDWLFSSARFHEREFG
jgi:REP element-mobilizing transposase RayT